MKTLIITILLISSSAYGVNMDQMDRIKKVFTDLRADNIDILDGFYSPEVEFIDPLGTHKGRDSVKKYYKNLYQNVTFIEFIFLDTISDKDKHVLVWKMNLKAKNLNSGQMVSLHGNSVIKFDSQNLVSYHRDYFDMGEFLYEHIPVLGWIIKKIKTHLK